jgi:hypothetical protein
VTGQLHQGSVPLYGLLVGVSIEIVAGVIAFLTDVPLLAVVLFMVGIVLLGVSGDVLSRSARVAAR